MRFIAVYDNESDLLKLTEAIKNAYPNSTLSSFLSLDEALSYVNAYTVHIAFIKTDIDGRSGLELIKPLQKGNSYVNIIFITDNRHLSVDYLTVRPSGCLIAPLTPEVVAKELRYLRFPPPKDDIKCTEKYFMIKTDNSVMAVLYSDIYYTEYENGKMKTSLVFMGSFVEEMTGEQFEKAVAPLLEDDRFIRINKSCIVNMETIERITDNSFVLDVGWEIQIPSDEYSCAEAKYSTFVEKYGGSETWF